MATNNKTSVLIDSLLPDYLETEGPKFQTFIKAYYEWLETTNQVTDRSKNLENYQDIDRTLDEFVKYFRREVLTSFPEDILANKPLVYKKIKDLYYAKGTENAYKLLFKILFDEEIEFYYPGNDILIASDGRWIQENTIRLSSPFTGNPELFGGADIEGLTSGATAKVNRVVSTTESGIPVFELFLSDINGTFTDGETVRNIQNTISGIIISSVGPIQDTIIRYGGANHVKGDVVNFISATGSGANGVVLETDAESLDFTIVNGGSGYANGVVATITNPNTGQGASATVSGIFNTEIIPYYSDTIEPFANIPLNTGPTFVSTGANTSSVSANIASANISSVLSSAFGISNAVVGTISSLNIKRGANYTASPSVDIKYNPISNLDLADGSGGFKGRNAVINASLIEGSISKLQVNNSGTSYNRSNILTVVNQTRSNTENALAAGLVSGVISYDGAYKDTKGFLSWNNKLQDNYYYQEFSYVVRSTKALSAYEELAYSITHPAGTRLFGEVRIEANVDSQLSVTLEPTVRPFDIVVPDIFIPTIVSDSANTYVSSGEDGAIVPLPELEIPLDISIADVSNYDILTGNGFEVEFDLATPINVNNVELYVIKIIEDVTIPSSLQFGEVRLSFTITPDIIEGTPIASLLISSFSSNVISEFAETRLDETYLTQTFGDMSLSHTIDINSVEPTSNVSNDTELDMNIGGTALISIVSTASIPSHEVLQIGAGTISNFQANTISDLSATQISEYDALTIDSLPGNKIIDGLSTSFTGQLSAGTTLLVQHPLEELTLTISSIDDANTLSITSNAVFSNGDIALFSSNTYFYT